MSGQTSEFIKALFGEKPERAAVQVWHRDQPPLTWTLSNLDSVVAKALEGADHHDVYVACGLAPRAMERPSRTRLKKEEVCGIPGVWADIDINGGPDSKTGACPDLESAIELAHELLEPTLLVHSGYGLQAWWLLEEPWMFPDHREQTQGKRVVAGFQGALRAAARRRGYGLDHTHDLSRVLRIPGTFNHKAEPVAVRLIEHGGKRYSIEELAEIGQGYALQESEERQERAALEDGTGLVLTINKDPQLDNRVVTLMTEEQDFMELWQMRKSRGNSKRNGWSASEFEFAITNWLYRAGLTPQAMCDALVYWRLSIEPGDPKGKCRTDRLAKTIGKVMATTQLEDDIAQAEAGREEAVKVLETVAYVGGDANESKVMGHFNRLIGGPEVARLKQYSRDPVRARFVIELSDGREVILGPFQNLASSTQFRKAFATFTGHYAPAIKPEKWDKAVAGILKAAVVVDEIEDTAIGQMRQWIRDYVESSGSDDRDGACNAGAPFIHKGVCHIHLAHFMRYLRRVVGERVDQADVTADLRGLGYVRKTISYTKPSDERTTRSYFVGTDIDDDLATAAGEPELEAAA